MFYRKESPDQAIVSINTSEINKGVYIIKIEGLSDFSKVIHKN